MDRIEELEGKLRAREGVPGYEQNCGAIREEIARLKALREQSGCAPAEDGPAVASRDPPPTPPRKGGTFRSAITGKFVSREYAEAHPDTTVRHEFR